MNILVVSRVSIPAKDRTLPAWEHLRSLGHHVMVQHPGSRDITVKPDAIISMGVTVMDETFQFMRIWPGVPMFAFNWDCYEWIWEKGHGGTRQAKNPNRPNEYNYIKYGSLLSRAKEIWVPSDCTGRRTEQWYGLKNWHTILSAVPYWDYPDVQDKGYIYCALREIPDPHWGWLEKACKELNLPLVMTQHEKNYEEYQQSLAHCSFLVSHCYELSTGGLSLLEGYYLGKPCLLSNSEWHGGWDYMGERAEYFQWDDYDGFKTGLIQMMRHKREMRESLRDGQDWVRKTFSDEVMIDKMLKRMQDA